LRGKVLMWERERERPSLWSNSFVLGNDFSYLVGSLKMKVVGVYYREKPPSSSQVKLAPSPSMGPLFGP